MFFHIFLMALALFFDDGHLDGSCQVVDSDSPAPELSFEKKATWGGARVTDGQSVLGHMKDT
jgi:hypothetical protein